MIKFLTPYLKNNGGDVVGEATYHVFHLLSLYVTVPEECQTGILFFSLTMFLSYICLTSQFCSPIICAISTCSRLQ